MARAVLGTWGVLIALFIAPMPLPEPWRYYLYSPASVGLWMMAMLVSPFVICIVKWEWIKNGKADDR
ncbi:hypothetical protein [Streptomyces sp. cmx-4-9]|uniref:hypothetical protein n=1 Tax=Streptomyces sp. cmx-4-9 TaxID=2790941 RepID=UPI00397F27CF